MLDISNLSVTYAGSGYPSLNKVTIRGQKGELVVVGGPSGCGKSTLAKVILGLIPHFEEATVVGEIRVAGRTLDNLTRHDILKLFGYLPQYPYDSTISLLAEEEVAFPLENSGVEPKKIHERMQWLFRELGIEHLQGRIMTELSSGELQKVSLATAIACQPPILVLDEPMARVDSRTGVKIAQLIQQLARQDHLILVFEHHLEHLLPIADRLIILRHGQVVADGIPRSVVDELDRVDLPEVCQLHAPGNSQPLSLDEAVEGWKHYIQGEQ